MKDGIIKATGNSRLLKAPETIPATFAEFRTALVNGTLPVDLLFNAAGWDVEGTPLNKANLLTDAVATALGLSSSDPTVNEALNALLAVATTLRNGLMSAADKSKLDGVAAGANKYTHPNHSGDVTSSGDGAQTIAANAVTTTKIINDAVTNAKLANMAVSTIKGRATAGTGDPEDLTVAQVKTILGLPSNTIAQIATGTYTGNDATSRQISVPFAPKLVIISTGPLCIKTTGYSSNIMNGSFAYNPTYICNAGGFLVSINDGPGAGGVNTNNNNYAYNWIAVG